MKMIATIREDMVIGRGTGTAGVELPDHLAGLPLMQLRWNGAEIIDASTVTQWHIDAAGAKRLDPGPNRQPLTCAWDDELILEGVSWRARTAADDLIAYAATKRDEVLNRPATTALGLCWCDRGTRADIGQAIQMFDVGLLTGSVQFKLADGWRELSRTDLITIAAAVGGRVQTAFETLFEVTTEIQQGTITTKEAIDQAAWPA